MIVSYLKNIGGATFFKHALNLYPPLRGAGIKILRISPDFKEIQVTLKMRWYNKNYVGTQYGGSIYSMTDPFYMLILLKTLGPKYKIWDRAATVDFILPGRTDLIANFRVTDEELETIKKSTDDNQKFFSNHFVDIVDADNNVVAKVKKTIYVRRKLVEKRANI
eukprot:TRINITY_DN6944_c0_g1_i1.p1 TRINITY_DN6944_c0_g1~~TRINITY_DN6944_c0_g1_i1.p1  ORF type:complete len:164 (-),score=19.54 TRINITY_DN6944_c0_g1_i1:141-632(-)